MPRLIEEALTEAEARVRAVAKGEPPSAVLARRGGFRLSEDAHIQWFARLLIELARRRATIRAQAREIDRQLLRDMADLAERFRDDLEDWLAAKLDAVRGRGRPRKSIATLTATLGRKQAQARGPQIVDRAAAARWAEANDYAGLGQLKYVLDEKALLARLKRTGEVVEGVEYVEAKDTFYVRYREEGEHTITFASLARQIARLPAPEREDAGEDEENEEE